ncbi:hypothetical protein CHS0354_027872 [Potamilus streckersoni]|uniref:Uncharacterized protein n=1 Tax=Potamilus streckersoni TaxID=2493646 RepID=A0AAE0W6A9_9BIVA|nr:hypothetical protein CHS0354_027872 [Potamilus streckersoni]
MVISVIVVSLAVQMASGDPYNTDGNTYEYNKLPDDYYDLYTDENYDNDDPRYKERKTNNGKLRSEISRIMTKRYDQFSPNEMSPQTADENQPPSPVEKPETIPKKSEAFQASEHNEDVPQSSKSHLFTTDRELIAQKTSNTKSAPKIIASNRAAISDVTTSAEFKRAIAEVKQALLSLDFKLDNVVVELSQSNEENLQSAKTYIETISATLKLVQEDIARMSINVSRSVDGVVELQKNQFQKQIEEMGKLQKSLNELMAQILEIKAEQRRVFNMQEQLVEQKQSASILEPGLYQQTVGTTDKDDTMAELEDLLRKISTKEKEGTIIQKQPIRENMRPFARHRVLDRVPTYDKNQD